MPPSNDKEGIKITLEDLARVGSPETSAPSVAVAPPAAGRKSYGSGTNAAGRLPELPQERGSMLLQRWFDLGLAGLLGGALAAIGRVLDRARDRLVGFWGRGGSRLRDRRAIF